MLSSIEPSSENIIYGPQIASAYIMNNKFEKAIEWIELYENAIEVDSKSIYARILLDLYSSNDLNSFINSIIFTLNSYTSDNNDNNAELLFILKAYYEFFHKLDYVVDHIFVIYLIYFVLLFVLQVFEVQFHTDF